MFDMPPLSTKKPSVLMAKMLALVLEGDQVSVWFLVLFLRRLPEWMRRQLKAGGHTTPDELSVTTNELWEDRGGAISAVQPPNTKSGNNSHKHRSKSKSSKSNWCPRCCQLRDYPLGHCFCAYHWAFGEKGEHCRPG